VPVMKLTKVVMMKAAAVMIVLKMMKWTLLLLLMVMMMTMMERATLVTSKRCLSCYFSILDAACNIQRVHYRSMKCDVFIFTR